MFDQINKLKERIKAKVAEYKKNESFDEWVEPQKLEILEAKDMFTNTLFVKIKGEISPDDLYSRQTGYWRIAHEKKRKIRRVVVVHDSVITRIFDDPVWYVWEEDRKKFGYHGIENVKHEVIGTIIKGWDWQQTVTYSNDMY